MPRGIPGRVADLEVPDKTDIDYPVYRFITLIGCRQRGIQSPLLFSASIGSREGKWFDLSVPHSLSPYLCL